MSKKKAKLAKEEVVEELTRNLNEDGVEAMVGGEREEDPIAEMQSEYRLRCIDTALLGLLSSNAMKSRTVNEIDESRVKLCQIAVRIGTTLSEEMFK